LHGTSFAVFMLQMTNLENANSKDDKELLIGACAMICIEFHNLRKGEVYGVEES